MRVIGVTGGIGSGKSTVSQFLAEMGAVVLDADRVGHQAYQPGTDTWKEVVAAFGEGVVAPDGTIDRRKLGAIVFGDPKELERLNRIVHPRMFDMMKAQIQEYRRQGVEVVVLEAAVLLEANWTPLVDEVWVTVASEPTVVRRATERTGLPEEQVRARIRSQLSNEERARHADVVIKNEGDMEDLHARVKELWEALRKG